MTFWETVERGEYVMIALAVLFILSIIIWWVRSAKLGRDRKTYPDLMHRVRDHVIEGDIDNARQLCDTIATPGAKVVETGLSRVGKSMLEVTTSMQETALIEKDSMTRGIRWLRFIAVISPLLGLGGTLVGIIDRLRDLGELGPTVDLSMLCGAISPTIVTTVAGLGVGIFALVAITCLDARIDSSRRRLDELTVEFTDLLNEPA
ncbi:MAG: MotA/TolQ/ExbB proton channel family protein [Muribaculaceae bacterium]|nr:MotA/TolQ/ExbB proton channel family protein [Muribaculaceae bacterium]